MRVIRRGQRRLSGRRLRITCSHQSSVAWRRRGDTVAVERRSSEATNLICANLIGRDALSCVFFQLCPLKVN